tara:strand:- start:282 stop:1028 length:747 start_codon:yes stop_codon:yes gene_type:complete
MARNILISQSLKYLFIYIFTFLGFLFSQNLNGNIGLMGQFPRGEFKEEGVNTGLGIDLNFMYYPVKELAFGLNLGGSNYGYSERKIPFSYYSSAVTITEKTSNEIFQGHLFFRLVPLQTNIKPYFEGLIGLKNLSTRTELVSDNCNEEEYDNCQIAESTNASDTAISYGIGSGLEIKLLDIENEEDNLSGELSFFINGRYFWGASTEYLKQGSFDFTDPSEGPVETSFNWSESKTDLLQVTIGVSFQF